MTRVATLFAFVMVLAGPGTARAQQPADGAPCSYELCAVRYTSGFSGEHLLRGASSERALRIGFTGGNAVDFLGRVESAAVPAQAFRTKRTRSIVVGVIGSLAVLYGTAAMWRERDPSIDPSAAEVGALVAGFGLSIWSAIDVARSRNDLSRAIWEFNGAPVW